DRRDPLRARERRRGRRAGVAHEPLPSDERHRPRRAPASAPRSVGDGRGGARRACAGGRSMNLASDHGVGRTTAALLGGLPLSLAASVALARTLPLEPDLRFTLAFYGFFAIWP